MIAATIGEAIMVVIAVLGVLAATVVLFAYWHDRRCPACKFVFDTPEDMHHHLDRTHVKTP